MPQEGQISKEAHPELSYGGSDSSANPQTGQVCVIVRESIVDEQAISLIDLMMSVIVSSTVDSLSQPSLVLLPIAVNDPALLLVR